MNSFHKQHPIKIDRLALEGDGVGRIAEGPSQGKVVFVPYSVPGEDVQVRLKMDKKDFARGIPVSVQRGSPSRAKPRCPLHFQPGQQILWCGGCDWQHMTTVYQKQAKSQLVSETLSRMGGVKDVPLNLILGGDLDWRYRNKVQVPFQKRGSQLKAGFFAPGSHDIVDFNDCVIQPDISVSIVREFKDLANKFRLPIYDEDRHRGWLRHLLIRTNEKEQALVSLVATGKSFPGGALFVAELRKRCPSIIGVHLNIQSAQTHVIVGPQWVRLWGADHITEAICGFQLRTSPGSFFQVNTRAAIILYEEALRQADPKETGVVLDLYCGVGAMTLMAARKSKFAIGVEEAPSSIRDADANAQDNGVANVKFVRDSVERWLHPRESVWAPYLKNEELKVIIDPPRTGCKPEVLKRLIELAPRRIVYVSCNPATLARDIKILSARYRLSEVTPVDLFPQTSHIEAVARLDRL